MKGPKENRGFSNNAGSTQNPVGLSDLSSGEDRSQNPVGSHNRRLSSTNNHVTQTGPLGEPAASQEELVNPAPVHKSLGGAYTFCILCGIFGGHNFYLRRYGFGVLYIFTLGLLGLGWIVDILRMPQLVKNANKKIDHPEDFEPITKTDAYILWFPFGLLGFHQYYIRGKRWGLTYTFTLASFGIGWIFDAFRIPALVREANSISERQEADSPGDVRPYRLDDAYMLGLSPAGIFGAHHYYMGNNFFGVFYSCTFGLFLQGWLIGWLRMYWLVDRANNLDRHPLNKRHKYLDAAYLLGASVPSGILGLHHLYLERTLWFRLYLVTHGLWGIGWLVDLVRMPCLVEDTNKILEENEAAIRQTAQLMAQQLVQLTMQNRFLQQQLSGRTCNNAQLSTIRGTGTPTLQSASMTQIMQPPSYSAVVNDSSIGNLPNQPPPYHVGVAPQGGKPASNSK